MKFGKTAGLLLAVAVVTGAGWFFLLRPRNAPSQQAFEPRYVDSTACAGCHADIAKTYRNAGMGRSFSRPKPGSDIGDFTVRNEFRHAASNRRYAMTEREGQYYVRRSQTGFEGRETNVMERRIDYVIGSGNHARSFLHRTPEGRLIEIPVSWYAEKGGYWAMSPGFDRARQSDFQRTVLHDCLFCHNGYPSSTEFAQGGDAKFGELPEGIDCQRCHGPGSAHIEAATLNPSAKEMIRKAIVNPASLSRERQLDVCMQCHLETTSARLPHMIRRSGVPPFSYKPGEPLTAYATFFDHAPGTGFDDKFEIAHAAYRLRKSACFNASEMTCTTCHNPHDVPRGGDAVRHYTAKCRTCHETTHASEPARQNDCASCHMPERRTEDAVHVVMTDHYIQRKAPARDLLAPLRESEKAYRGKVLPYYPSNPPAGAESDLYLAMAQVQHDSNLDDGLPLLEQAIATHRPAQPEFYFELGRAWTKRGDRQKAIAAHEEALRHSPSFRPSRSELAALYLSAGQAAQAVQVLEQTAEPDRDAAMLTNLANAYLRQANADRARGLLERALALDTDRADTHNLLGMISALHNDAAAAERSFRYAIRVNPDLAEAHNNLANLLGSLRKFPEAAYHFEQAIAIDPHYAAAHHRYALALLVLGQRNRALAELKETIRLDPANAEARNDLAELMAARR